MSRPRILSAVPQEAWDPDRDPEEVHREPGDPARDPWDVGWLLEEKRPGRPQGPRVQPTPSRLGVTYCSSRQSP